MENIDRPVTGFVTEVWHDELYGSIPMNGSRVSQVDTGYSNLSGVVTLKGDHKTANSQAYVLTKNGPNTIFRYEYQSLEDGRYYSYTKRGNLPASGGFMSHSDPDTYNKCLERLSDSIRGSVDLSIDAFQGRQTLALIGKIASVRKIVQLMVERSVKDNSAIRRRNSAILRARAYSLGRRDKRDQFKAVAKKKIQPIRTIGSYWLEYQYGVVPILQSIHDITSGSLLRAGNNMALKTRDGHKIRASNKVVTKDNANSAGYSQRVSYETLFRYEIGGHYTPSDGLLETMSRYSSLNPVSIAWELLPFSFVVDWFYDIGGYLRSAETALVSNQGSFSGYITFIKREKVFESYTINTFPPGMRVMEVQERNRSRVTKSRTPLTSFPFPRRPSFSADLGSGRLLNAAALLSQLVKG